MKVLKIPGIIIGSFIGVFALVFFLYPYINEDHFNELIGASEAGDSAAITESYLSGSSVVSEEELELMQQEIVSLQAANNELLDTIDSLEQVNEDLQLEIREWENMEDFMPVAETPNEPVQRGATAYMSDEEFSERVKSLLNLDEDELSPIVREMDDGQLIRLYYSGGNIQREKLLRSLEPARAARVMNEVML